MNPFLVPTITDYHPNPITAGTGDTLFIVGKEFGDTEGIVRFSNADDGGISLMQADTADLVWSDTLIKVRMPSLNNDPSQFIKPAGSDSIQVETSNGLRAGTSGLEVRYAVLNRRRASTHRANRVSLADLPEGDGNMNSIYTISIDQNVVDPSGSAVPAIAKAMCDWTKVTGIQWNLGDTITGSPDSVNLSDLRRLALAAELQLPKSIQETVLIINYPQTLFLFIPSLPCLSGLIYLYCPYLQVGTLGQRETPQTTKRIFIPSYYMNSATFTG